MWCYLNEWSFTLYGRINYRYVKWSQFECTKGQHIHKNISAIYYMNYIDIDYSTF